MEIRTPQVAKVHWLRCDEGDGHHSVVEGALPILYYMFPSLTKARTTARYSQPLHELPSMSSLFLPPQCHVSTSSCLGNWLQLIIMQDWVPNALRNFKSWNHHGRNRCRMLPHRTHLRWRRWTYRSGRSFWLQTLRNQPGTMSSLFNVDVFCLSFIASPPIWIYNVTVQPIWNCVALMYLVCASYTMTELVTVQFFLVDIQLTAHSFSLLLHLPLLPFLWPFWHPFCLHRQWHIQTSHCLPHFICKGDMTCSMYPPYLPPPAHWWPIHY